MKALTFVRKDSPDRKEAVWHLLMPPETEAGVNIRIRVNKQGIAVLGGTVRCQDLDEQKDWDFMMETARMAYKFAHQGAPIPPEPQLIGFVLSYRQPEEGKDVL